MHKQFSQAQNPFEQYPVYRGDDLGLSRNSAGNWQYRIWSPPAEAVEMRLYKEGSGDNLLRVDNLEKSTNGSWVITLPESELGRFFTFRVKINGSWLKESPDPYVKAVGVNGERGQLLDLTTTHPKGWLSDQRPKLPKPFSPVDAIIYELQIRDASIHPSSGIQQKGKYLGLAEINTRNKSGELTGLSHIRSLGVTHVHLLPFFDFQSIDESKPLQPAYNWGYDPLHYGVPEGSFSTKATDPATRIRELKTMIAAFHQQGLRVVMDVVYNHTGSTEGSVFNQLVPRYYYRQRADGTYSDATACGNETASERPMMRKYMIENLLYWMREYHIDGFRFDLMGVHDIETMQQIADTLRKELPDVLLYGEGWTAGASTLPENQRALKKHAAQLHGIAVFGDDLRDGIKGSVFEEKDRGFASGKLANLSSVQFGLVGAGLHPQVDMQKVNYSKSPFTTSPEQVVAYAECHDNHTLYDKLRLSMPGADERSIQKMHLLALSIVLTSQGIPFLHAGTEFLRSKQGVENSYNRPDSINAIRWDEKTTHKAVNKAVEDLIAIRKAHPAFRLRTTAAVQKQLQFLDHQPEGILAFTLDGKPSGDSWKKILVVYNGQAHSKKTTLPKGTWKWAWGAPKPTGSNLQLGSWESVILYQ